VSSPVGQLPGGSGNGPSILAHFGRPGTLPFSAASRVSCSERLCENPEFANRVPTGGQDRAPAKHSGPISVSIPASPKGQVPTGPTFHTAWRIVGRPTWLMRMAIQETVSARQPGQLQVLVCFQSCSEPLAGAWFAVRLEGRVIDRNASQSRSQVMSA